MLFQQGARAPQNGKAGGVAQQHNGKPCGKKGELPVDLLRGAAFDKRTGGDPDKPDDESGA